MVAMLHVFKQSDLAIFWVSDGANVRTQKVSHKTRHIVDFAQVVRQSVI
jgi:predicted peroxiredoxin